MAASNDLLTDQRVDRHRRALTEAGFDVVVLGRREVPTRHWHGWQFYYEFNRGLRHKVAEQQPDIVWANDTDTLLGCYHAARRCHAKLVLDCHELFPEVPEIQHKPLVKWVWRTLERWLMPKCNALLTVCNSIAEYYRLEYGVSMAVVRNLRETSRRQDFETSRLRDFESKSQRVEESKSGSTPISDLQPPTSNLRPPTSDLRLLLYQGRVNLGRGVDWAIDALEWLPECHLVVAGDGDLLDQMKAYATTKPWADRIRFTGRITPDELHTLTPQADVGLVMLEDMGLNYHYALPNRIGDFVQAGVPMVVSDLPEMSAVVKRYRVGEVMRAPGAKALAESIKRVLEKGSYDFGPARRDMDWNKEKQLLIKIANKLCSTTSL